LQDHLDRQSLVLYEGVKGLGEGSSHPVPPPDPGPAASTSIPDEVAPEAEAGSLQISLARSLGLVFQLQAMDYDRPQFKNSDLTADQIQRLMMNLQHPQAPPDEQPPETEFDNLVDTLRGTSVFGAVMHLVVEVIGSSPHLQALTKLAMIELLGQFKGDLSRVEALPPEMRQLMEVLIRERNQQVMADLKAALQGKLPPASVAVVYGAAHLADMELRVRRELRYCPSQEFWLPVFSVNTARAGLSQLEMRIVRSFIRSQLDAMHASQPGPPQTE